MRNFKILVSFILIMSGLIINAQDTAKTEIHQLLNEWHHAAAVADADTFFGSMTADAHYIGTDQSEDWTRDEMREWANEIFKRDSAWDFETIHRNIYLSDDGRIAWFDETLETWMGVCRGSGIVVAAPDGWKIKHYVLSVAVPNSIINDYLEICRQHRSDSKP